jgi:plastocyanin
VKKRQRTVLVVAITAFAKLLLLEAVETNSALSVSAHKTGTIEGVLKYHPDSQRPWKFSRYYVSNPKDNYLAEAVVALEGAGLVDSKTSDTPQTRTMDQINYQFVPETMAIRVGDAIRISNSDDALHNVMTSDGDQPFNVNVAKGKEIIRQFDLAGGMKEPVRLGCVFHGGMRAWVYVFDHPWFKVTERDGRFRFADVPTGTYDLCVVHPAGKLRWSKRIVVKSNEKTSREITLSPDDLIGVNESK